MLDHMCLVCKFIHDIADMKDNADFVHAMELKLKEVDHFISPSMSNLSCVLCV